MVNGKGTVGKLLKDEQLFNDLQQSITTIKIATTSAQQMIANANDYTRKLTAKGSLANDLVTDTVIFARLRSTVREIDGLSDKANAVMQTLNEASTSINQKLNDKAGPVGLLLNDKETAEEIRATIRNLQAGTQKLDENMEALQHNFLFRGFFRKQAKAK
jgi:phospholipid/cholesterol/gamma-HCH transport system substrate-binding protein